MRVSQGESFKCQYGKPLKGMSLSFTKILIL